MPHSVPRLGWLTITPRRHPRVPLWSSVTAWGSLVSPWPGFPTYYVVGVTRAASIALRLRLWLRRAIRRINDRTVDRIVQMVGYNSLRALYNPISIVELE